MRDLFVECQWLTLSEKYTPAILLTVSLEMTDQLT